MWLSSATKRTSSGAQRSYKTIWKSCVSRKIKTPRTERRRKDVDSTWLRDTTHEHRAAVGTPPVVMNSAVFAFFVQIHVFFWNILRGVNQKLPPYSLRHEALQIFFFRLTHQPILPRFIIWAYTRKIPLKNNRWGKEIRQSSALVSAAIMQMKCVHVFHEPPYPFHPPFYVHEKRA